jgi:hypothetical protein
VRSDVYVLCDQDRERPAPIAVDDPLQGWTGRTRWKLRGRDRTSESGADIRGKKPHLAKERVAGSNPTFRIVVAGQLWFFNPGPAATNLSAVSCLLWGRRRVATNIRDAGYGEQDACIRCP